MAKNILSDTDYTKGWDNRFGVAVVIGKVQKIECSEKGANVRVSMPDRVDHEGQPLITKPVPVLQIASQAKKSFAVPRCDDNVLMVKLANGTSNYVAIGSFYTSKSPPPVTDPLLDYTEWEGGHTETRDANEDAEVFLKQDFKGGWDATIKKDVNLKTTDGAKMNLEADGDVLVKSATGNINVESPTGTVNIKQQKIVLEATNIELKGAVKITGAIDHTGNMETHGVHHDNIGYHTAGTQRDERIAKLEAQVRALEIRFSQLEARYGG
jgi:phage baseplate assembly protein gpV